MALTPLKAGTSVEHAEIEPVIIANSVTLNVGDLVQVATSGATQGFATPAEKLLGALGVVVGFANTYDAPLTPDSYAPGTAAGTDVQQVVAAANNQTVAQKVALVNVSTRTKYSAQVNGTLGTTNSSPTAASKRIGGYIDIDSDNTSYGRVLESTYTAARSKTSGGSNFFVWGVDPNDSTRLIVSLCNSVTTIDPNINA